MARVFGSEQKLTHIDAPLSPIIPVLWCHLPQIMVFISSRHIASHSDHRARTQILLKDAARELKELETEAENASV